MDDQHFIRQTIALAADHIRRHQGGPFAALVVLDDEIIGQGCNRVTSDNDPTAHAEIEAIRDACRRRGDFRLTGHTLYVNCEPCPMCLAAAYWADLKEICYAAERRDAAAIDFADQHLYDEITRPLEARSLPMRQLLRAEALEVFEQWRQMPDKIPY